MPSIIVNYPVLDNSKQKAVRTILIEFAIGQVVCLKVDPDHKPLIITSWLIDENGVTYGVGGEDGYCNYYSIELLLIEDIE